jgi:hypothetical protein
MLGASPLGGDSLGGNGETEVFVTATAVEVFAAANPDACSTLTAVEVWATVENLVPSPNGTVLLIGF